MKKRNRKLRNGGIFGGAIDEARALLLRSGDIREIEEAFKKRIRLSLIFKNRLSLYILSQKKHWV